MVFLIGYVKEKTYMGLVARAYLEKQNAEIENRK